MFMCHKKLFFVALKLDIKSVFFFIRTFSHTTGAGDAEVLNRKQSVEA